MLNGDVTCTAKIKTTFHVQHTIFVHFFNIVLHDLNVKFPSYTVRLVKEIYLLTKNVVSCVAVRFFSLPLIFHLANC